MNKPKRSYKGLVAFENIRLNMKGYLSKSKIEVLHSAFQQIEPFLREYMKKKNILEIEIKRDKSILVLEPIKNCDREAYIQMWLDGDLSTEKLIENMKLSHWYVQYFLDDFLDEVDEWMQQKVYKRV